MTYKPFRAEPFAATPATFATTQPRSHEPVAKVADVAALRRSQKQEYEERAAICEHDGGLSRGHAEQLAALESMPCPDGVTEEQRNTVIDAAARFLDHKRKMREFKMAAR
jgi:acyl-CoA reductase-like NAD-dependent aldehyde dehydrogenase